MNAPRRLHHAIATGLLAAGLLAAGLLAGAAWAVETFPPGLPEAAPAAAAAASAPEVPETGKPSVSTQAPIRPAPVRRAPGPRAERKPAWAELTPAQQQALAPLAGTWRSLGEPHKRKWIALSQNFATMTPADQALLHSRMTEWAALSPQQRTRARLNFAEAKKVAPSDKRAKWEAYQALPPEEKRKLAARAAATRPAPPATAAAARPVPPQKLVRVPRPRKPEGTGRIAVVPGQVDRNTLLPQPLPPTKP